MFAHYSSNVKRPLENKWQAISVSMQERNYDIFYIQISNLIM